MWPIRGSPGFRRPERAEPGRVGREGRRAQPGHGSAQGLEGRSLGLHCSLRAVEVRYRGVGPDPCSGG